MTHRPQRPPHKLVLGSLLAATLTACNSGTPPQENSAAGAAPGFVLYNINGYTPTETGMQQFSALWVENGRIKQVGDAALKDQVPAAQQQDGQGRTVLPGLIDAHGHVLGLGIEMLQVDLRGTTSLAEAQSRVREFAAVHSGKGWLLGRGWNQVLWEGQQFPAKTDLDAVVADRPVFMTRVDGHAGWANSHALAMAGITRDTPDPVGGQILKDAQGEPTGVLIDTAMELVGAKIPGRSAEEVRQALKAAMQKLASEGITSVHDAGVGSDTFAQYETLAQHKEMSVRVYAMVSGRDDDARAVLEKGPRGDLYDDKLSLRSVKLYADGALGSRGAALHEDYSDLPGHKGLYIVPPAELTAQITFAASKGWQVNVHAIGDAANTLVLESLGKQASPFDAKTQRHRIEHAQVVRVNEIPLFSQYGIVASMQPTHATSDMNMAETRIGSERIKGAYAWRSFRDHGAVIAAGSDFPVELSNPFLGLHAAVTREDSAGQPQGGWYPAQKLKREEALRAFTLDAAWAAHQEKKIGSLEAGKWADFIVLDRDYFEIPQNEIDDIRVLETWVAGKKVTP